MLRKILIVFSSVMILVVSCVLPCAAIGTGIQLYMPLQFDELRYGTNFSSSDPWAFNSIGNGSSTVSATFTGYAASANFSSGPPAQLSIDIGSADSVRLTAVDQIVRLGSLQSFCIDNPFPDDYYLDVTVSFKIMLFQEYNNMWNPGYIPVTFSFYTRSDPYPLGQDMADLIDNFTSFEYVRITDLAITITCNRESGYAGNFEWSLTSNIGPNGNSYFNTWVKQFNMTSVEEYVFEDSGSSEGGSLDLTAWLRSFFSGFWNIEFLPNFTLGGIVSIVLGALFVFALIKLFGGGG